PEGVAATNIKGEPREVRIENLRVAAPRATLDVEGFQLVRHETAVADFWDEAQTMALGHPETAELVKAVTGAARVVVFDHTLRRRLDGVADRTPGSARQPAARVHVDQTVFSGPQRVQQVMGAQADALLKRRAAIINVWRPIHHVARDWPLAFADARSVAKDDLIAQDLIFPHRKGEIYGVAFSEKQRWLYAPDLAPDEAVLIKCWDSDADVARFTPHTGFDDPTTPAGAPPRESIEFRTIAFF
ncbi:MAG TPA: CmcJ/NvfI family oxidoreductase, partial [Caulobacteraceae bacterium]|nr:CmcJ/NvfI family oxidoreductase [Caulobacteraceae bacterium]